MPGRPRASSPAGRSALSEPLEVLYEEPGLPFQQLPPRLAAAYGGDLGFAGPCLYANFVTSLDGVVALGHEYRSSGAVISGREPADRFVMGLLRACADAVLIGAGTLRASPSHHWTPEHVCPAAHADFAALRHDLGRAARPELVVVTASGDLPLAHPALREGALVATTIEGRRRLAGRLPANCSVLAVGEGQRLSMGEVLPALGARGHTVVLTEGGPRLLGHLVGEGLLDELFWTVSPVLAGRDGSRRPGLVDGRELLPDHPVRGEAVSVRRRGPYLFLRYRISRGKGPTGGEPHGRSGPAMRRT